MWYTRMRQLRCQGLIVEADETSSHGVSIADEVDSRRQAYGGDHIAEESTMVAVACVGSQTADVIGCGQCCTETARRGTGMRRLVPFQTVSKTLKDGVW